MNNTYTANSFRYCNIWRWRKSGLEDTDKKYEKDQTCIEKREEKREIKVVYQTKTKFISYLNFVYDYDNAKVTFLFQS